MNGWALKLVAGAAVLFAAMQAIRPARTNPAIDPQRTIHAALGSDTAASKVIDRSCRDCHSHATTWPWYSQVAPVSWLVAHDVNEGRDAVNFSEWAAYAPDRQRKLLADACEEVSEGEMPGLPYRLLHPDTRLAKADVDAICALTTPKSAAARR